MAHACSALPPSFNPVAPNAPDLAWKQVDEPNRFGVSQAWSWLARCLNCLPADRYTAKALVAVLRVAGFALFTR